MLRKDKAEFISEDTDESLQSAIERAMVDLAEHPEMDPYDTSIPDEPGDKDLLPWAEVRLGKGVVAVVKPIKTGRTSSGNVELVMAVTKNT